MSPQTTFTEEITETQATTIRVCDSCMYREFDGAGHWFSHDGMRINLCGACVDEFRANSQGEPLGVVKRREWLENTQSQPYTNRQRIQLIAALTACLFVINTIAAIAAGGFFGAVTVAFALVAVGLIAGLLLELLDTGESE